MSSEKQTPLAIVGIGCLFPKAGGLKEFWSNIKGRVDGITEIPATHWSPEDYYHADPKRPDLTYARRGGFLSPVDFDPAEFGISPNNLEATDAAQLLGLVTAQMALRDAGYGPEKDYDRSRVSVILGVTGTLELVIPLGARLGHPIWRKALKEHGIEGEAAESIIERIKDGYVPWQENSFPGLLGNVVAGRIANRFNLGGTNCVVDAACASSLSAAHLASLELQTGRSKMVVTGGADCFNDIFMYMCFSKTPALSPTGDSKPFDKKADGTILGEGIGMVVLKRLDDAEKDGDRVYAVLKGVGSSSDGRGKAIYAPSAEGQTHALRAAYGVAGVTPDTIELVEAHGTGTTVGDGVEVDALSEVYREAKEDGTWCALGSVKSMIGHTKAAAGSAGMIKAALSLYHKTLPPTIKVSEPIPQLAGSPFYLNTEKRPWLRKGHPRRAAVSALGFGGSNFHAVLEEHRAEKTQTDWDGDVEIVALSGPDRAGLETRLSSMSQLSWDALRVEAARSRETFRASDAFRFCFVAEKGKKLPVSAQTSPEGAFLGQGAPGKLAVLFPGQGSQYVGMGRDLACAFPEAFDVLARGDAAFEGSARLSDIVHPFPAFGEAAKAGQEAALRSTDNAQPALGVTSLGAFRVLEGFGLRPDALAGHSYGELTALCASGRMEESDLHRLSGLRGRLMAEGDGGRGGMLAVQAPLSEVERLIAEEKLDLVIANKNAPNQSVLSGLKEECDLAAAACGRRGVKCVKLPVSAAFHSPLVAGAAAPLRAALEQAKFAPSAVPVFANKTASAYPAEPAAARDILASQLASPVEFTGLVRNLYAAGVTAFFEVGPGARLTGLVSQIVPDAAAFALDASNGRRSGAADLARALAQLAALGYPVALRRWQEGAPAIEKKTSKMAVRLSGANHRSTRQKSFNPVKLGAVVRAESERTPAGSAPAVGGQSPFLPEALRASQESLLALQRLQEQTAALHLKFLETQEAAQRQILALIEQRQGRPSTPMPAAAAPAPVPATPVKPVPAPAPTSSIDATLLAVVSEKTGYPVEMLNPDMDLESDLGIDSIKRVEILSAIQEKLPGAPKVKPEHLGTLRTLRKIADFLGAETPLPATAPASNVDSVLLSVVSEKTGYPVEMLNPDMDLESDLGIDSIKRVEILSAIQEKLPGSPKVKPEHLGTLRTLRKIADFLGAETPLPAAAPASNVDSVLLAVVSEKTGYPIEMLNPDMDLESDLGIDSIKRVEILSASREKLPGAPEIKPEHLGTLRTLRQVAAYLKTAASATPATQEAPVPYVPAPDTGVVRSVLKLVDLDAAPRAAVVIGAAPLMVSDDGSGFGSALVAALIERGVRAELLKDPSRPLSGLVLVAPPKRLAPDSLWDESSETFLKDAFAKVRAAAPALRAARGLFATVTRLDGAFGLTGLKSEQDPVLGGLAGLAKTAAREWPEVSCKAIDAAVDASAALVAEELMLQGPLEVGVTKDDRKTLVLEELEQAEGGTAPLAAGDVVVVTGGARGVTAEAALALAPLKPTLVLLGRSPVPETEEAWLASCRTEAEIKKAVLARSAPGATPKTVGARCVLVLAAREIRAQLRRFELAGAKAIYVSADARDAKAVAAALAGRGPVRGVIHGAGVLADKLIAEKTSEQVEAVLSTKLGGLRVLLSALDLSKLKFLALFSSSTARFGRVGQSDYAVANEAMNKAARLLARRLPECRVASFGWGPWDGGMVDASLKKMFASEGVGVIGLEAGGRFLARELSVSGRAVEVVVVGRLAVDDKPSPRPSPAKAGEGELGVAFERELRLQDFPFLRSHVINGRPVLPFAFIVEWLAHAALHGQPGLVFRGWRGVRVYKGVVLAEGKTARVQVLAGKAVKEGDAYAVRVELRSGAVLHAGGTVLLGTRADSATEAAQEIIGLRPYGAAPSELYRDILFHGPDMQVITRIEGLSDQGISVLCAAAPPPREWIGAPLRDAWLGEPAALDAAFQALIVWSSERYGARCLPSYGGSYRQFRARFPEQGTTARAKVLRSTDSLVVADVDFLDAKGGLVARLEGCECTIDRSLNEAFRRNACEAAV